MESTALLGRCGRIEAVAAYSTAPGHVVYIFLIDRENPAGLGPAFAIHPAQMVPGQHGAGEAEMTARPALQAISLADTQLPGHVAFTKMDREKSPDLTYKNA
ncbi:hypothetical protein GTA51_14195 [Desulfovibrio aerotolerans]|uniref:Uncharacterized protein n=1 Tax=Solidesulfovibrio aerotolerans TaxID=295255 RepID=A0A7C9IPM4_9BACT|nr:hypothetical protein [Solidesulfovibrio aerotolerans]MYL84279.1 hypothetical protein [Solidesulfovibrio aerotolerans]